MSRVDYHGHHIGNIGTREEGSLQQLYRFNIVERLFNLRKLKIIVYLLCSVDTTVLHSTLWRG